jgi:hypothetical protein
MKLSFTLKCVICDHTEERDARNIPEDGPVCPKCFGPMIPQNVETRNDARKTRSL